MSSGKKNREILRLRGMRFYAYHGAFPEEEKLGGQFVVEVELGGDFSSDRTRDEIKRTINLDEVYELVEEIVTERRFNLIETLAEEIAETILDSFKIESIAVKVRKENPPIPGAVEAVEAEVFRSK